MRQHRPACHGSFPVFVSTGSITFAVPVDAMTDVPALQSVIAACTGIPAGQQVLLQSGRRLLSGLIAHQVQPDSTLHVLGRLLGGQKTVTITVQPRVQKDKWSMYWKESMCTKTECLKAFTIEADLGTPVSSLHEEAARMLNWQHISKLVRLEGFKDPWEFSVFNGRALRLEDSLRDNGITSDAIITLVRNILVPEAWKSITDAEADASSSSESEDWEQRF